MTYQEFRFEEILPGNGLDAIHVYWRDIGPAQGSVVIECWGCAWACYWGGMPASTVREFFARADVHYLVTKLGITPLLKCRKRDNEYLARIVTAIRQHILPEVAA